MEGIKDKYDIHFEEMFIKLQECQREKGHKTCSICEKFLECEIRDEYVIATYESMSKGKSGGFDF
ncbi:hypothetical protein CBLAS_1241 [Campylobacter blaseri]|uniref:hypothetical protein n=1 Tax=Campylobacter blaseri TaxID=2042961 RepID=UPI00155DBC2F|nr:hypothetical protein [Campylobacter blaseri]QKF86413.1 hypothetical protein CBLAS_1241 [Campylobacter blaseri]